MTLQTTQAVILAGGLGTRLRATIGDIPKPLAEVNGRPFLAYQLDWLKRQGITHVVLCVGYRHELIEAQFGDGASVGMQISYSVEREPLGTGGALLNAENLLRDPFLAMNGDTYFELELGLLLQQHTSQQAVATMGLVHMPDTSRFGAVALDAEGHVTQFLEKGRSGPGLINAGIYALSKTVFDYFPVQMPVSLERDVFPLLSERQLMQTCTLQGFHLDIGTPESYAEFIRIQQRHGDRS
ncbi:MAG: nucleotidyltransferase family protein [Chloroflexi bacterium]|nr:nucleotidyltransferase family protein [Chloroflexota bacterium]MCL5274159.1 nucleotidyltransferase family protein [Chloroflexota bacterium]